MPKLKTKISQLEKVVREVPKPGGKKVGMGVSPLKGSGGSGITLTRGAKNAMLQKLGETDHMRETPHGGEMRNMVPLEIEKEAIVRVASGAQISEVCREMDITKGYVAYAMKRRFGSAEAAKKALQGLVLENALACMVHGGTRIGEMSGPQAIMSGAILTDKALALEKSMEGQTRVIDFGQLAEMGKTLRVLREIATVQTAAKETPTAS